MTLAAIHALPVTRRFSSSDDSDDPRAAPHSSRRSPAAHDELPYRVELWDEARQSVEMVLAITAHGTIGYAAFYAAAREHPQRYITLRHDNKILSRWSGGH